MIFSFENAVNEITQVNSNMAIVIVIMQQFTEKRGNPGGSLTNGYYE